MIVDCAYYRDGRRQGDGAVELADVRGHRGQAASCGWAFINRRRKSWTRCGEAFGLHGLAVEDARTFHRRPKVELYEGDVRLVILRTTRYDEEVEFGKISVFAAPDFVITVRQGRAASCARPGSG